MLLARRRSRSRKASTRLLQGKARPRPDDAQHDTNETFIPMTGKWRCSWENEVGKVEHIDLDPLDVLSFPPGAIRRFENATSGDRDQENIMMFVIGGNGPPGFTDKAMPELWPASGHQKPVEWVQAGQSRSGNRTSAVKETRWVGQWRPW
jgi:hypothetical protein